MKNEIKEFHIKNSCKNRYSDFNFWMSGEGTLAQEQAAV